MNIKHFAKTRGIISQVAEIKRYSTVEIWFCTKSGQLDQTQIDIDYSLLSNEGIDRLEKLFNSLAVELNAETTGIRLIEVLASADTMDELRRD